MKSKEHMTHEKRKSIANWLMFVVKSMHPELSFIQIKRIFHYGYIAMHTGKIKEFKQQEGENDQNDE